MSDPNQPAPPYPTPEQPAGYPPPTAYGTPPPPPYGTPQPPPYGATPVYYGQSPASYASWLRRVGGALLDTLLLLPFYAAYFVGLAVGGINEETYTTDGSGSEAAGFAIIVISIVLGFGFGIWNQIIRQGRTGQSLGKQWVGIRVVKEQTGQPLGGWLTFGRSLLHILDQLPCYLGYLWPLWDKKRQTFADKIVSSVVLYDGPGTYPQPPPQNW